MGRIVPEFNRTYLRELIYKSYRIVYRIVDASRVDVITIQHGSRDMGERLFEV